MQNFKKILLFIALTLMPMVCFAAGIEEPDYEVSDVYISASLDFLGSMQIKEAIVVKGSLNGYIREVEYKNDALEECDTGNVDFKGCSIYNARGMKLSKVSASKIDKEDIGWDLLTTSYENFEEVDSASEGDIGKYIKTDLSNGMELKTYNKNDSGYIVYYYEYYINQAVVLHEDVAELYYTFFKLDEDVTNSVNIQVTTPGKSAQDVFRFWAHGALYGEIAGISEEKNDEGEDLYRGVLVTLDGYEAGDPIDIRMTFDKSLVSLFEGVLNESGEAALDKIIDIETDLANEANLQRTFIKVIYYGISALAVIYLIGLIILWIFIYRKYDKEYDVNFDHKYYREFTGNYNVEVVDYLLKEDVGTNALNASIMNLIYKKNIEIEEIPNSKKDLILHLKSRENVTSSESLLLDLLFTTIGKENKVTLKEIEKYSSKYSTAETFMAKYDTWKNSVILDGKKEEFYEKHTHIRLIAALYFFLGIGLTALLIAFNIEFYVLHILIALGGIAFFIYALSFKKLTKKGREHSLKWKAFKNFLKDFGNLKEKEIPEIVLWDKYLVYATLFGIAKEVQKAMQVKLTEINTDTTMINTSTIYTRNFYIMNTLNDSISKAHTKSRNVVNAHNASSSSSSGGGFGGGLSGGGGFAGGGGGGGRGF